MTKQQKQSKTDFNYHKRQSSRPSSGDVEWKKSHSAFELGEDLTHDKERETRLESSSSSSSNSNSSGISLNRQSCNNGAANGAAPDYNSNGYFDGTDGSSSKTTSTDSLSVKTNNVFCNVCAPPLTTTTATTEPTANSRRRPRFENLKMYAEHLREKATTQHGRVYQATTLSAFVIFLKSLFGVTLLFQPRILGETGLVLGSICHALIIGCCTFACYLLLKTRQKAMATMMKTEHEKVDSSIISDDDNAYNKDNIPAGGGGALIGVKDRLITYGDLIRQVVGRRLAKIITLTILSLHIMFASGMVDSCVRYLYMLIHGNVYQQEQRQHQSNDESDADGENNNNDDFFKSYYYVDDDDAEWRSRRWLDGEEGRESGDSSSDGESSSSNNQTVMFNWIAVFQHSGGIYTRHPLQRLVITLILFPFIVRLLQIHKLSQMFVVSSFGLLMYFVSCGTMIYSAILLHRQNGGGVDEHGMYYDHAPSDRWEWKWGGIPAFVASTVYAIEGINLALPTANTLVGSRRSNANDSQRTISTAGTFEDWNCGSNTRLQGFGIVACVMLVYGVLTLGIAWIGYIGGLGGGPGTAYGEDACRFISYCLGGQTLTKIYQASLFLSMLLTLPVILYPATELLEMWQTERDQQAEENHRLRRTGCCSLQNINEEEADNDSDSILLQQSLSSIHDNRHQQQFQTQSTKSHDVLMKGGAEDEQQDPHDYACGETFLDEYQLHEDDEMESTSKSIEKVQQQNEENQQAQGLTRHRMLRLRLAIVVCILAYLEGYFYSFVALLRGVFLSSAGFCIPPILYYYATKQSSGSAGTISWSMKIALIGLFLFGLFNILLVAMNTFNIFGFKIEAARGGPGEEHHSSDEDYYEDNENIQWWWSRWPWQNNDDEAADSSGASVEDYEYNDVEDYAYNYAEDYEYNDVEDYEYNDAEDYEYNDVEDYKYEYNNDDV